MLTEEKLIEKSLEFALSINPSFRGFYKVLHQPESKARPACCFLNVQDKIDRDGGSIYYGWTLSHRVNPDCGDYLLANHHAVWRPPIGDLVDVTPFGEDKRYLPIHWDDQVLFLPHDTALPVTQGRITAPRPDQFYAVGQGAKILNYVRELTRKEEREHAEILQGNFDPQKVMGTTMELHENTSRALAGWIGPDTWYTNHPFDTKRFYKFVDQYEREHGTYLDEGALIEEISERLRRDGRLTDALQEIARTRVYLASNILDFLEASERETQEL